MRFLIYILMWLLTQSCSTVNPTVYHGFTPEGNPVYLSDPRGIPDEISNFYAKRDLSTEEGKIDYLIYRVQDSDFTFVRNREKFDGAAAAEFLRWKLPRLVKVYHYKVDTAEDFILKIASESRTSGKPYVMIDAEGNYQRLQDVLQNELNLLEYYLRRLRRLEEKTSKKNKLKFPFFSRST